MGIFGSYKRPHWNAVPGQCVVNCHLQSSEIIQI